VSAPVLSVVVGTYNRIDQIKACIESIQKETRTPTVIYVTDAGSEDGTIDYLQAVASETIRPVLVGKRVGQARAYNEVFDLVQTPYVAWLSDDNVVIDRGLDCAVNALETSPDLGMVGLKTRDVQGPFVDAPYIGGISSIGIINVNQGVLRTDVLRQVGGFSEAFRDYGIDPDLTAKVLFSGYEVALTRGIALLHYRNWDLDPSSPAHAKMQRLQAQYQRKYALKYSAAVKPSLIWVCRKAFWRGLQRMFPRQLALNGRQPILGLIPRDWNNVFAGRYVHIWRELSASGKSVHLFQRCPRRALPKALPPDPMGEVGELVHSR
jgi:GT2 family glycosyltransferase